MSQTGLSSLKPLTIERSLCIVDITYAILRPWTTHTKHSQMCCWFSLSPEYDVHLNKMCWRERDTNKQTNKVRKRERERKGKFTTTAHTSMFCVCWMSKQPWRGNPLAQRQHGAWMKDELHISMSLQMLYAFSMHSGIGFNYRSRISFQLLGGRNKNWPQISV